MCIDWVVQTTALNLLVHLGSFTLDERAWLKTRHSWDKFHLVLPRESTSLPPQSETVIQPLIILVSALPFFCVVAKTLPNYPFGLLHQLNLCLLRWAAIMVALRVGETRALRQQRLRGAQLGRTQSG